MKDPLFSITIELYSVKGNLIDLKLYCMRGPLRLFGITLRRGVVVLKDDATWSLVPKPDQADVVKHFKAEGYNVLINGP